MTLNTVEVRGATPATDTVQPGVEPSAVWPLAVGIGLAAFIALLAVPVGGRTRRHR